MTLICCFTVISSCAGEGSGLSESGWPAPPENEATMPTAPVGEGPVQPANGCRTMDDCSESELCVMGRDRYPVCVAIEEGTPVPARGPKGQPPPPAGLFEGAPGFSARAVKASR